MRKQDFEIAFILLIQKYVKVNFFNLFYYKHTSRHRQIVNFKDTRERKLQSIANDFWFSQ